jgi:hypothetical protein
MKGEKKMLVNQLVGLIMLALLLFVTTGTPNGR